MSIISLQQTRLSSRFLLCWMRGGACGLRFIRRYGRNSHVSIALPLRKNCSTEPARRAGVEAPAFLVEPVARRLHRTGVLRIRFWLFALVLSIAACSTPPGTYRTSGDAHLLIPLGSTLSPTFTTVVSIDDRPYEYSVKADGRGNSWAIIALSDIGRSAVLTVRYNVTKREPTPYRCTSELDSTWLEPDYYIDWQDESILSITRELDLSGLSRSDAARTIGEHVLASLSRGTGGGPQPAAISASASLAAGTGVCINHARLFVALCRASGIPARTVSGVVRHHSDPSGYDLHHEWMEYLDEERNWHQVDLGYVYSYELSDPRYAGFVYGAEDHAWFAELDNRNLLSGQPLQLEDGDIVLFHYHPVFKDARYGFELIDSMDMEYYTIQKTIGITISGDHVMIEQIAPAD